MTTTWTVSVDWERSGTFDGNYDDITDDVIEARWFLGMQRPYLNTGDDSQLLLRLRNDDRHFSPEYASSPLAGNLQPFRPIRIQSDDGTTVRTHWIGWIESIAPSVNQYGEQITEIIAAGPMKMLKAVETTLPLQEQVRTDELLSLLVLEAVIPPAITNVWVVGRARLGEDTALGDESDLMDLQEGLITLTMAADNWVRGGGGTNPERKNFSVYRAMQDVAEAERGRFFFRRDGKAVFWNRDHLMLARTAVASFSDVMTDLKYEYAGTEHFQNEIVVGCHPRSISATSDEVLWELESPLTIPEGSFKQLTAKYEDESGGRVGGRNTSVEFSFSSGSGTVSIDERANQATLTITNTGSGDAVLSACTIEGQKILDLGRMEAMAQDLEKAAEYGRRVLQIDVAALNELEEAQAIADFELERRKDPRGTVGSVMLKSHGKNGGGQHAQQLVRTIGDLITVSETQTDHSEDYYIVGEEHRLSGGATLLETTWYLEPTKIMWLAHYDKRYQDAEVTLKGGNGNTRLAQSFEPVDSQSAQSVRLWLKRVGSPSGNLTLTIREDDIINDGWELGTTGKSELGTNTKLNSDGAFPGDVITNGTSTTVAASDLEVGFSWVEFAFSSPPNLTEGTVYWLVLETSDSADALNHVIWGADSSSPAYGDGEMIAENNNKWVVESKDSSFQVLAA